MEDCRSQAIGGLAAGIELWELAVIPMLLNNSGTWTKRTLFAIRNKMVDIPNNFSKKGLKEKCFCGEIGEMEHLYECEMLGNNSEISYEKIYSNNVKDQIEVFRRMEKNLEKRKIIKELEIPGDPISDLLHASSFG